MTTQKADHGELTKEGLEAIVERLEGAGGGDQGAMLIETRLTLLPAANNAEGARWSECFARMMDAGAYESAALALVERALPGWGWMTGCDAEGGFFASLQPSIDDDPFNGEGEDAIAPTPALALCLALSRALQQGGGDA